VNSQIEKGTRITAYAAVYLDRGERLTYGRGSIPEQLEGMRRQAEEAGAVITMVGVDVIMSPQQYAEMEGFVTEAERLAHEAFAGYDGDPTFYCAGLVASSQTDDPRDQPGSARSMMLEAIKGSTAGLDGLVPAGEVEETEHGYAMRFQPLKAGRNDPCPCGSGKKFKHCHGA
jgi:hypothetical protein